LQHWDIAFWSERLREHRYAISDEELRPYFPLPQVLDGLFALVQRLFGVTIRPADGSVPVWHPDVRFFRIYNANDEEMAAFYLDAYSRPAEKRGGAWMDGCVGRSRLLATPGTPMRLPVAYLICNQTPPVAGKPSLMSFTEVKTLFHEFGHGLHHMLTQVDYGMAAGIRNVEWDAVELPSQFMENWCYHRDTLMGMSGHVDTGEPLPEALYQKLLAARNYRSGSAMLRQLYFGFMDMELHARFDPSGDETVFDVQRRIAAKTTPLMPLPEDRFLCSFGHIFAGGYAAGYYSYKWAEVLSADAFAAFEESGLDDERALVTTGQRYRDTVLALGGSQHPMEVFKAFRGREPSTEALLRHAGLAA
jgi:oligopeptidase A